MQLRHELEQLKRMIFGAKQERFVPGNPTDPAQLSMGLNAEQADTPSQIRAKKIEYTCTKAILTNPFTSPWSNEATG
jgi:hypothetical protein